ncbi:MAG TPA: SUMF1/EgtB/PvdO family nonheme iron enzyme [Burkholderiaceae bacterium]|nr:SUMF1/EgtB/PvdO family nonheme iron enzyme [Burkholderiaceae bacterium]HQR69712.1 SUMF1/EgtB/PvdO family nonheme iron enzyme [Burkholderiaceae bacterium]
MDAVVHRLPTLQLHREVREARAHTDALFALVNDRTLYERPIPDRHRLIFYLGHLDAFDWNQLGRGVLDLPSFQPSFDRLFEAGIDPPPGQAPADLPSDWPALEEVRSYVGRTRQMLDEAWDALPAERVLTALEHRWMHAETLCYLLHELPANLKHAPLQVSQPTASVERHDEPWVRISAGTAWLGQAAPDFGWDNEFPRHPVAVHEFDIARYKVTNRDYLRFVAAGGPAPHFWLQDNGAWRLRRMFDIVPLPLDEPVYLTHRQSQDYAGWANARLPTEAEWQRAACGDGERRYPWGNEDPTARHANLDFTGWDPVPVNANPAGATPEGTQQMLGNGWEWTATPFAGFDGFSARPYYPGYSANFFDGEHFVMKGGSPRTARRLARASFRNWFRRDYPYTYSTARLAR